MINKKYRTPKPANKNALALMSSVNRSHVLAFVVGALVAYLVLPSTSPGGSSSSLNIFSETASSSVPTAREQVNVAMVSCKQYEDVHILIQSILYHFDRHDQYELNLYFFNDEEVRLKNSNPKLLQLIEAAPHVNLFEFDVHEMGLGDDYVNLFKTCAGVRLSFPMNTPLANVDKIIYLDTDTLVMRGKIIVYIVVIAMVVV